MQNNMSFYRGQGATEYLVLLAVVLIVALVSVALLGFFPGMASDSQMTQSKAYWLGASPIQIFESDAKSWNGQNTTCLYIRIRNAGAYPIRITKVIAANGSEMSQFQGAGPSYSISDYYYMAPGEEKYFGSGVAWTSLPAERTIGIKSAGTSSSGPQIGAGQLICQSSNSSPGTLSVSGFGFEYIEYIEGQQITKRQVGKPLIIKCGPPF